MNANCSKLRICRYFLRGICRFGQACRYRHERPICRHFQRGSCLYGQRCKFLHVLQCETATPQMHDDPPTEMGNSEAHRDVGDVTCGICMDNVYAKSQPKDRRFGILPNCIHSFCEPCILTWRQMAAYSADVVKGCPMCRVRSDFYVPSESWVEGAEKEQLIVTAKQKCRYEYCSFFAKSGRCPFEEDCQFAAARTREARLEFQREASPDDEEGLNEEGLRFFILVRSSSLSDFSGFVHV